MRRRRVLMAAAAASIVALPVGWYLGSPWWTLWRMREAARAGDMRTLASYVDLGAVERAVAANAGARLGEALVRGVRGGAGGGGGWAEGLRAELGRQIRGGADTVRAAVADMPLGRRDLVTGPLGLNPLVERRSFDEFVVRVRNTPSPGTLTFRRHGLGWKLEALRLGAP